MDSFIANPERVEAYLNKQDRPGYALAGLLAQIFNMPSIPTARQTLQYLMALWNRDIVTAINSGLVYIIPYLLKYKSANGERCDAKLECGELVHTHDKRGNYTMVAINNADQIPLPNVIRDRLREWFKSYYRLHTYSCAGFLYYMIHGRHFAAPSMWNTFPVESDQTKSSNFVLLTAYHPRPVQEDFHFALFIPELNSYLSQFGNGGRIVITGLEEMNRFFHTDKVTYIKDMTPLYQDISNK